MSNYMLVYYSLAEYLINPDVKALADTASANGGNPRLDHSKMKSSIIFSVPGQTLVTKDYWEIMLASEDVEIEGGRLYSPVVPSTTLDNKVPADWPNALKPDPNDPESTVTKKWQEYTHVIEVDGGYVLRFCDDGMVARGNLTWGCDKARLEQWITKFGGYLTIADVEAIKTVQENL